jgi:hypothetical protein
MSNITGSFIIKDGTRFYNVSPGNVDLPVSYVIRKIGSTYEAKALNGQPNFGPLSSLSTLWSHVVAQSNVGKIHFTGQSFTSDARLVASIAGLEIEGEGQVTQMSLANGVNDTLWEYVVSKIHHHDMILEGNYANQSGTSHGILADTDGTGDHHMGPHLRVQNFLNDGIHNGRSAWGTSGNMGGIVEGNMITGNQANGLYQDYSATDWQIFANLITTSVNVGMASIVENAGSCRFGLNHLWGSYYDINLAPTKSIYRSQWVGNGIMDCKRHGIHWGSSFDVGDSKWVGNDLWSHGKDAADTYDTFDLSGSGNFFSNVIMGNNGLGYKEDVSTRYTRRFINDVNGKMTLCTVVGNAIDYYHDAAPIVGVDYDSNEVSGNRLGRCGL